MKIKTRSEWKTFLRGQPDAAVEILFRMQAMLVQADESINGEHGDWADVENFDIDSLMEPVTFDPDHYLATLRSRLDETAKLRAKWDAEWTV